jgi:hypothetical protein
MPGCLGTAASAQTTYTAAAPAKRSAVDVLPLQREQRIPGGQAEQHEPGYLHPLQHPERQLQAGQNMNYRQIADDEQQANPPAS